jgi:tetratricopeptide (TPR) repeat protein
MELEAAQAEDDTTTGNLVAPRAPSFGGHRPSPPHAQPVPSIDDAFELLEDVADEEDRQETLEEGLIEDDAEPFDDFDGTATQTRPAVVLPPKAAGGRPREAWVQRAESLLDAIERQNDRPRRMALHRELAALLLEHGDAAQAFEVLVAALSEDVDDDETVHALERLAHEQDRLGDLLRTALSWSEDIEWMRDPPRLGALLLRLAKWYGEDVRKVEWGMPFAERARRLLHERDPRPHRLLARLHRRAERWADAESALEQAIERATSASMRADLHVERGKLRDARGDERARVREAYAAALEADPTSEAAIQALDAALSEEGLLAERIAAWERRVASLRAPAQLEGARFRLVELLQLGRQDRRAARVLTDIVDADPEQRRALKMLSEVQRRLGDSVGLRASIERAIDTAPTARDRVELLIELAALRGDAFLDHDAAVASLESVLELDAQNEIAHGSLARIHRSRGRLHDLARVLERQAQVTVDRDERAAVLVQAARVLADELGERERALALAERARELAPSSPEVLELVGRLYQEAGELGRADEALRRALETAVDATRRAELLLRRAQVRDLEGAPGAEVRALLDEALDHDPAHLGALEALRALARADGDPEALARACVRELEATHAPTRRVALLLELARLRAGELDDLHGAIACWDEAFYIHPTNTEAAAGLIEPWAERGRWSDVHALAGLLLSNAASKTVDRALRQRWHALHGRALAALGRAAEASSALAEAVRLDAGDVQALAALAEARFAAEDWDGAYTADRQLLPLLDPADLERLLTVHHRMGRVQQEQGKSRGAIGSFQQALAIEPEHKPTLERLCELYADRRAWPELLDGKRRLAALEPDLEARCKLLVEIADLHRDQLKDPRRAVEVLEEAVALRPRDHVLLHRKLEALQQADDWAEMTGVLDQIAETDRNPQRRAKYFATLAQIRREKSRDLAGAAEGYELALDEDPTLLKAFESLVRLHTEQKAWKALERSYRRMLHRLKPQEGARPELELELWMGLGLVYRDRLRDDASALEAFRMASRARPDDARVRRILAELHAKGGRVDDAAQELHTAIAQHPLHAEPYRALFRLYRDARKPDRAFCLAAALVLLEKADDEIRLFHAQHNRRGAPAYRDRLDPPTFVRAIRHPAEDLLVAKIFEILLPAVRASRAVTMRASIAPPPDVPWQERATTRIPIARAFFGAADVLGIPAPRLAVRPELDAFLVPAATEPPSTVAGRRALALTSPQDMLFVVGQHLSTWRGDAHLRVLLPSVGAQQGLLLAALKLGRPDVALPQNLDARAKDDARTLAQFLEPVQLEGLRVVVKRFLEAGGQADLAAFARGIELTAARTGLLLCGDLPTAVRGFDDARLSAVGIPASEVVSDLVAWFVSPDHLELRERLGIGVDRARG